jgi:CRISPR-associated endonuclease/helicase Cas3
LSATLPTRLLRLLEETLPGVRHVRAEPETFAAFGRHRLRLDARSLDADAVVAACRDAGRGAAVLVVVNRVQRAIELGRAVRAALPGVEVEILHARFCGRDRTRKERNLLQRRGPGADEPLVCVATQVVEVSLDVDFDVGLFEVAPFDAVVQRMGRVNRRRRHDRAEVVVFAGALEEPAPYEGVHVEAAWSVLAALGGGAVDEAALGQLLDEAVERAGGQTWEDAVMGARREFERAFVDALPVFDSNDQAARFDELFDGVEVLPAPLRPEYERTLEAEGSLAATELLVPVSARRNWVLRRRGLSRWDRTLQQWVVESAYDADCGLLL